jgi:hypothetical protein
MSLTYAQYVTDLANLLVIDSQTNAEYQLVLPNIIDDAEQRIYRELDLLSTIVRPTAPLTPNSRNFTFPQHVIVSESINVFYPLGTSNRKQLVPVAREFLDAIWGNETATTVPSVPDYYAMITDQDVIVGPPPDAAYVLETVCTIRPAPLSASNTTTVLSLYLPDVFMTASLIFGYGYLKDYGAATDDPNAPGSWESHYGKLIASANIEEQRKRYASQAWTPKSPATLATPPRA